MMNMGTASLPAGVSPQHPGTLAVLEEASKLLATSVSELDQAWRTFLGLDFPPAEAETDKRSVALNRLEALVERLAASVRHVRCVTDDIVAKT